MKNLFAVLFCLFIYNMSHAQAQQAQSNSTCTDTTAISLDSIYNEQNKPSKEFTDSIQNVKRASPFRTTPLCPDKKIVLDIDQASFAMTNTHLSSENANAVVFIFDKNRFRSLQRRFTVKPTTPKDLKAQEERIRKSLTYKSNTIFPFPESKALSGAYKVTGEVRQRPDTFNPATPTQNLRTDLVLQGTVLGEIKNSDGSKISLEFTARATENLDAQNNFTNPRVNILQGSVGFSKPIDSKMLFSKVIFMEFEGNPFGTAELGVKDGPFVVMIGVQSLLTDDYIATRGERFFKLVDPVTRGYTKLRYNANSVSLSLDYYHDFYYFTKDHFSELPKVFLTLRINLNQGTKKSNTTGKPTGRGPK